MTLPSYALITPARNEARFIELTLRSMLSQTVRPVRWAIVSDGSTDGTDEIVERYARSHPWIEFVRMPPRQERHFAGKVHAFDAGYAAIQHLPHDVVGNLDADVSFSPDHFEFLLGRFAEGPTLGVVGAPFREAGYQYDFRFSNIENVWGGCQLFARRCFQDIGGYMPVKGGGVDHIAVVSARMLGWQTRTFTDRVCTHHRQMGTAEPGFVKARFKAGVKDYSMGNHPLWQLFRSIYQMTRPPLLTGGLALACGYAWSWARRMELRVPRDLVIFTRREQMGRLRRFLFSASDRLTKSHRHGLTT